MLTNEDIQVLSALLDAKLDAKFEQFQQATDAKFEQFQQATDAKFEKIDARFEKIDEKFEQHQQITDEKIEKAYHKAIETMTHNMNVLLETKVEQKLNLLYEQQQIMLETFAPKSRVETLEDEVCLLKQAVRGMAQDIAELKKTSA